MFTGLIREVGRVAAVDGGDDGVRLDDRRARDRRATRGSATRSRSSGVCLTVVDCADGAARVRRRPRDARALVARQALAAGARVNVEPALRAGEPLGGHYVQGHVDGVGVVRAVEPEGDGRRIWVDAPPDLLRYVVEKGSIAVEGTSLTVAALDEGGFAVALIPHTLAETTLGDARGRATR